MTAAGATVVRGFICRKPVNYRCLIVKKITTHRRYKHRAQVKPLKRNNGKLFIRE